MKKLRLMSLLRIAPFLIVAWIVFLLLTGRSGGNAVTTRDGLALLNDGKVTAVTMNSGTQLVTLTLAKADGTLGKTVQFSYVSPRGPAIVRAIDRAHLTAGYNDVVPQKSGWATLAEYLVPALLIGALIWFMIARSRKDGSTLMQFGRSRATTVSAQTPKVTFADVAGADEAIEELGEIKDFLQSPARFLTVGARIPRGVLLFGPPGTGKTLLARAVAGEAGVPFYALSGSDFVEMFVGVGASRVRDLFRQAKENAPAIIFVDELDAVGRRRGAGIGGGNDEREQTLNQLLVEMDGFDSSTNVILIAATNRPDVLDPALLRPGRFDRQVHVDAPDLRGRRKILAVHSRGKPLAANADLDLVARSTPGFTGADLANVLNEAALLTARAGAQRIDDGALDEAVDRVIAGPRRRSRLMRADEKRVTAYHEGGHAVTAAAMRQADPVTRVTILPRGRTFGHTMILPVDDKHSITRNELLDKLAYLMGGRAAEEIVFHDPTTGASDDIEEATAIARTMVTEYGMSAGIGPVTLTQASGEMFLGHVAGHERDYSEQVAARVDAEVRMLVENAHDDAWRVLNDNRAVLDRVAAELLQTETLDHRQLDEIFSGVTKLAPRSGADQPLPEGRYEAAGRNEATKSSLSSTGGAITNG